MNLLSLQGSIDYLKSASKKLPEYQFNKCVKYNQLSEIMYTTFSTLIAVSASFMSLGILFSYDFFLSKLIDSFLSFNYFIFGPMLFGATLLGYFNYDSIFYSCYRNNPNVLSFNLSNFIAISLISLISMMITISCSKFSANDYVQKSISYNKDGNFLLGKLFWKYSLNRNYGNLGNNANNDNHRQSREHRE